MTIRSFPRSGRTRRRASGTCGATSTSGNAAAAARLALEAPADAVTGNPAFIIAAADTVMNRPSAALLAEAFPDVG